MSDIIKNSSEERQKILKQIIEELHRGVSVEKLQKRFAKLIKTTSPEEIAEMENALIEEGFPPEEIQRLCDVHVQVFDASLKKVGKPGKVPGHPVYSFIQENKEAKKLIKQLRRLVKRIGKSPDENEIESFSETFSRFKEIEKHYQRKENQLFPLLESKKFTGPTKVMWGKHDEIRNHIKEVDACLNDKNWKALGSKLKTLVSAVKKMIFLEEKILYPTSARKLTDRDWAEIKKGEPEIGYAWIKPSTVWDADIAKMKADLAEKVSPQAPVLSEPGEGMPLSQGNLTREQVDLLLKNLPVDITFVDENDRVCYYSDTKDRIFPRSPAIIGRTVQNCHPHKSVHVVNNIVQAFREKKKDFAEFWIQVEGNFVHIRYFPLFDRAGAYRGVIEVSQEISGIKKLEGQRRLLDW